MLSHFFLRIAPGYFYCQQTFDEVFCFGRNRTPDFTLKGEFSLTDKLEEAICVLMLEGQFSGKKQEQNNAQTPIVAPLVVGLSRDDFGGDVTWCSADSVARLRL